MNVQVVSILGIKTSDVSMPGRLFLSEEGDLTSDIKRAKMIPLEDKRKLEQAVLEVKAFSPNYFREEVIPYYG